MGHGRAPSSGRVVGRVTKRVMSSWDNCSTMSCLNCSAYATYAIREPESVAIRMIKRRGARNEQLGQLLYHPEKLFLA